MKKIYLFLACLGLISVSGNIAFSQIVGANVFMQGQWLEAGVTGNGSWGSPTGSAPPGYHTRSTGIDFSYDAGHDGWTVGTDPWYGSYFMPGTPFDGWSMQVNGAQSNAYYTDGGFYNFPGATLTGAVSGYSNTGGIISGIWSGTAGPGGALQIKTTNRLDTMASWLVVTAVFKNTSSADMPGVYYFASGDPDNDVLLSGGSFPTNNHISYQNDVVHRSEVNARPPSLRPDAFSGLCTKDIRAKAMIYQSWPPPRVSGNSLDLVYSETATGMGGTYYDLYHTTFSQDIAFGLIYNIGTIRAGDSAIISFAWIFSDTSAIDSAFPEPLLIVNGVPKPPSGPAPAPTYDTFNSCEFPGVGTLPVDIKFGSDKCWSWSKWTWEPSVALSSTTGTSNTINIAGLSGPTTYTITGTDSATGMFSGAHRIFYLTVLPCFHATNNGPICLNDTLKLVAHGDSTGATYLWYGPSGFTSTDQITFRPPPLTMADTGIYYVIKTVGTDVDTVSTRVILKPLPVVTASSNAPICSGNTLLLSATLFTPGVAFSWTGPLSFLSTLQNPSISPAHVTNSGNYKVVTRLNGCMDSSTIFVRIDSTPEQPTIGTNAPICSERDTLRLTSADATAGVRFSWAGPASFTSLLQNPIIYPDVPVTASGVYTVTATLGPCSNSNTINVLVKPTPALPVLGSNAPICSGNALNLTATSLAGSTYSWIGPNSFVSGVQNPIIFPATIAATGSYSVAATLNGCTSDTSVLMVVVDSNVVADFSFDIHLGCKADTVYFTNNSVAASAYTWLFGDGYSSIEVNPKHIYLLQNDDSVKLYSSSGSCIDSVTKLVSHVHPLRAAFSVDTNLICQGSTVAFTDSSVGTGGPKIVWHFGDDQYTSVVNPVHTYPHTGIYKAFQIITDYVPCSDTAYRVITVDTVSPIKMLMTDTVLCRGTYVTFNGLFASIGNTGVTWDFGNGTIIKNINPIKYAYDVPGTYTVNVKADYRVCPDTNISRVINVMPQPSINIGNDTGICKGGVPIVLKDKINANNPKARWEWSTGAKTPSISVTTPGEYSVTVRIDGCYTQTTLKVVEDCYLNVPNVFSPNDDGINDYFNPRYLLTNGLTSFNMQIFNRWGQLIFETSALEGRGWDGKFNGVQQPEGVFIYVIDATFKDGQKEHHQGNVTLLR